MIKVIEQADLIGMNTLALPCIANYLLLVDSIDALKKLYSDYDQKSHKILIMGGGSNLVLPPKLDVVIKLVSDDIHYHSFTHNQVIVDADSGVNWDNLVSQVTRKGYRGIENLSLIPGSVGAAPVQNIGAYGVELADVLESVQVLNVKTMQVDTFNNEDCQFSYRDSIFKQNPGQYVILKVSLKLSRVGDFNLGYGELKTLQNVQNLTVDDVREQVIHIRKSKLPDPSELPNAGSFFKNPIVSETFANNLTDQFPDLVRYVVSNERVKLAAGWLIEQSGLKGFQDETVCVHDRQALVLVNHAHASQKELLALVKKIQLAVFNKFQVSLDVEPLVVFE